MTKPSKDKKSKHKLKLKRETIRTLSSHELEAVAGGRYADGGGDPCPSDGCPPPPTDTCAPAPAGSGAGFCNPTSACNTQKCTIMVGGNHNQSFRRRGR